MHFSMKRLLRSCVAMTLVLSMLLGLGLAIPQARAAGASPVATSGAIRDVNGDGKINYVAFGDSVTNGYGLDGYRYPDGFNINGFRRQVQSTYPVRLAKYLETIWGSGNVELDQLAQSGFRVEELLAAIDADFDQTADHYHREHRYLQDVHRKWTILDISKYADAEPHERGTISKADFEAGGKYEGMADSSYAYSVMSAEYRDSIKEADLISLALGTNNFGTFLTCRLQYLLKMAGATNYEMDFTRFVDAKTEASLKLMLSEMVKGMGLQPDNDSNVLGSYDLAYELALVLMYGYLGYTAYYDQLIEEIYELNPNVQIMVMDVYNTMTGVNITGNALGDKIDLVELYTIFLDLANFYTRELSPYANSVTHVTLEKDPEIVFDYYLEFPNYEKYPDSQGMHPTAERLLNEFILENQGGNPDNPDDVAAFKESTLDPVAQLDGYVNDLQNVIATQVVNDQIAPVIYNNVKAAPEGVDMAIEGVTTAKDGVQTAVEGVATAKQAVKDAVAGVQTAEATLAQVLPGVQTAIEGVEAARAGAQTAKDALAGADAAKQVVDLVVDKVVNAEVEIVSGMTISVSQLLGNESFKDTIISEIRNQLNGLIDNGTINLSQFGIADTEENRDELAEEIYTVAVLYNNNSSDKAKAEKLAMIEVMRFILTKQGKDSSDANLAYELYAIRNSSGEEAAIKAAMIAKTGETTGALAFELYKLDSTSGEEAAVVYAITTQSEFGEDEAKQGYQLYKLNQQDPAAAIIAAMATQVGEETAKLAYQLNEINENQGEEAAVKAAMASQVGQEQAELAYSLNALYEAEGEEAAVKAALLSQVDAATAEQALAIYSQYETLMKSAEDGGKGLSADQARETVIIGAIASVDADKNGEADYTQEQAAALYAFFCDITVNEGSYTYTRNKTTEAQEKLVLIYALGTIGLDKTVAASVCACFQTNKDYQFNDPDVKVTMITLMTLVGMEGPEAAYEAYLTYKNLPYTLKRIAKEKVIYMDEMLRGGVTQEEFNNIGQLFTNGGLIDMKPDSVENKRTISLATIYLRFMAQDGVFIHPSEDGQDVMYNAFKKAIDTMNKPTADEAIPTTDKILTIGDCLSMGENSYVDQVAANLNAESTNVSLTGLRINDLRAALDSGYTGDDYTAEFLAANSSFGETLKTAIPENEIILLNVSAMSMGFALSELNKFIAGEGTYPMNFSNISNMKEGGIVKNGSEIGLGATMDAMMENLGLSSDTSTPKTNLLLAFKSYGYGYTTFADCFDATISQILALNPDAHIVLVGQYDLMGTSRVQGDGLDLGYGRFVYHALIRMNGYMKEYARLAKNVHFVDVSGTKNALNSAASPVNLAASDLNAILTQVVPTTEGHAFMAKKISCYLGGHTMDEDAEITWNWTEDSSAATASFLCTSCGKTTTLAAAVTSSSQDGASCTTGGTVTYTATVKVGGQTYTDSKNEQQAATGHVYGAPVWTWTEDENGDYTVSAVFTCTNTYCKTEDEGHKVEAAAVVETTDSTQATCVAPASVTYTAKVTVEFGDKNYTDTKTVVVGEKAAHTYGEPVWTWTESETDGYSATAAFTCPVCSEAEEGHTITEIAVVTNESQNASCTQAGKVTYTAAVTFQEKDYTAEKIVYGEKGPHAYGEPTWNWADDYSSAAATFVCDVCDETVEGHTTVLDGVVTSEVTTPATCVDAGVKTYTAAIEGTNYSDTKEETIPATGEHTYGDDHICTVCRKQDPATFGDCSYQVSATLTSGAAMNMTLGGKEAGVYTFTKTSSGWTIQNANGKYVALSGSSLTLSDSAFSWTYSGGSFSAQSGSSSSSNSWWGSWGGWGGWGSNRKTTYYLVVSGSSLSVSTSSSGADAAFYITHTAEKHTFDAGVVTKPTCNQEGYTTYTCENCGYSYEGSKQATVDHVYSSAVTKPTCGKEGYTTYTCIHCGNSYVADQQAALTHDYHPVITKPTCTEKGFTTYTCVHCNDKYVDDYVDALGHNVENGVCTNEGCDYEEGKPDPKPEEDACIYMQEKSLVSGQTYKLTLGGSHVGMYTFTQTSDGWTIQNADGKYVALNGSSLTLSDSAFSWTYSGSRFSAQSSSSSSSNSWWGSWGGWGSSRKTTYYLVANGATVGVSTSNSGAAAKFYQETTGSHAYGSPVAANGKHTYTCGNCGNVKTETCMDPECSLCHPVIPEAVIHVSVSVTKSTGSSSGSWWGNWGSWGSWGNRKTTYTATISVNAENTEVKSVAYSTDNGASWKNGSSFTSESEITSFNIRVEASNGQTYFFTYRNGTVTENP